MASPLTLIVAGDPGQLTGGYLYDARMVAALRARGRDVQVIGLEGRFPLPDDLARRSMAQALAALPDGARVVIDGLAMGGLPEVIVPHADRLTIIALVHHPLADETGLDEATRRRLFDSETRALALVRRVIVTSRFTARGLERFAVAPERLAVVEPGVGPAPLAASALDLESPGPRRLLCVATLIPRKGHDVLLEALADLRDRDWTLEAIGSHARDPDHAARLFDATRRYGLEERIDWAGERSAAELAAAYHRAELFVLPSRYEGYGMVVTEALSRGVPVLTTTGGALADTLPPAAGLSVPPDDAAALREALAAWLDDAELRRRRRRGAREVRRDLVDWQQAGDRFLAALEEPTPSALSAHARAEESPP
ncbi:glycosyltransferase family 4 protein [Halomonas mongoliensis]|uniref:Glycosyltransferase family 4 protein n=1 Tax=Halomonas mongoliensis TaxID=321265 RepID=A0ABU1GHE0_9GAMM|nr:glycosyltransferase family 4 protein [Halomonas mongoliensis]MDR5891413.1 glycosyltransferase family 4 protein [Halomonas mongoliensis]